MKHHNLGRKKAWYALRGWPNRAVKTFRSRYFSATLYILGKPHTEYLEKIDEYTWVSILTGKVYAFKI